MIPVTLSEAQEALHGFLPRAGSHYATQRNFDRSPENRDNVSRLSTAIGHRVLCEKEVIQAVLNHYSWEEAEKFLQEVLWRSYWKSWLEHRPSVWKHYTVASQNQKKTPALSLALSGETGIHCFDFWRKELQETGYLHNHARMWFSSIWIFTLKLPWELGAELFERELFDFDAASNTLSWRWVAGLHTPGKHYLARAENIHQFTDGRFNPEGQLLENESAPSFKPLPIECAPPAPVPAKEPEGRWGLLIHEEDYGLERTVLKTWPFSSVKFLNPEKYLGVEKSSLVQDMKKKMRFDAFERHRKSFSCNVSELPSGEIGRTVSDWISQEKLQGIYLIKPWQGRLQESWDKKIPARYLQRHYDTLFYGRAKSGFFSFKESMKKMITELGSSPISELENVCLTN